MTHSALSPAPARSISAATALLAPAPSYVLSPDDFDATAIGTGGERLIRVVGSGHGGDPATRLELVVADAGSAVEPGALHLEVRERATRNGEAPARPASRALREVEAMIEHPSAREVVIFTSRGTFSVPVREAARLGRFADRVAAAVGRMPHPVAVAVA